MQRRFTKWLVSIAFLSTACGQTFSGGSPGGGSSTPDPGATPLPSMIQRDEAIALVTSGNADVGRVDRADAKLMTFADYLRVAGPVRTHPGEPPPTAMTGIGLLGDPAQRYVWAVAVSAEVWPNGREPISWGEPP